MNNLDIYVTGVAGTGKSAIIDLINRTLVENGFTNVTANYRDNPEYPFNEEQAKERLVSIANKDPVIIVHEVQSMRVGGVK